MKKHVTIKVIPYYLSRNGTTPLLEARKDA
jgi:hypothetical protein